MIGVCDGKLYHHLNKFDISSFSIELLSHLHTSWSWLAKCFFPDSRSQSERRKTSSGTGGVDEESFISMFSVFMDVGVILSANQLVQEMQIVEAALSSTDWTKKVAGFQMLRGLVNASASFSDNFITGLQPLQTSIRNCLQELRSQVIKEACVSIAFIAQQYQYKVETDSTRLSKLSRIL